MAVKKENPKLEINKLLLMKEPLLVRIEKIKGSTRQPIELPAKGPGLPPGAGYTRDEVLRLEQWLVAEWTGGGFYEGTLTDQDGTTLAWEFAYPPANYPEKVPPGLAQATNNPAAHMVGMGGQVIPMPTAAQQGPQTQQYAPLGYGGQGFPTRAESMPQAAPQQQWGAPAPQPTQQWGPPQQPPQQGWPNTNNGAWPGAGWGGNNFGPGWQPQNGNTFGAQPWGGPNAFAAGHAAPQNHEDRRALEAVQQQLHAEREERRRAEEKAERERAEQRHQAEMEKLRLELAKVADKDKESEESRRLREMFEANQRATNEMLAKLAAAITETNTKKGGGDDEWKHEMAKEREERRRAEEKADRDRERDQVQRERERAEEKAERERDRQQRAMEAIQAESRTAREQFQAQLLAAQNHKDPMLDFFKENSRQQAELAKERERTQATQQSMYAPYMISPKELATIVKDAGRSTDELLRTVTGSFGGILETYKHAFESVAQLTNNGPSTAATMLQDGLEKASALAGEWMKAKRDTGVQQAAAIKEQAKAQQAAYAAQAQAQAAAQQAAGFNGAQATAPPPRPAPQPFATPAPVPTVTTNGEVIQGGAPAGTKAAKHVTDPNLGVPTSTSDGVMKPPGDLGVPEKAKHGPSDAKMLGVIFNEVQILRKSVAAGIPAEKAVADVMQGVGYIQQALTEGRKMPDGTPVVTPPVFILFQQEQFSAVWDILLPQAPQAYRDRCTQLMIAVMNGDSVPGVNAPGGPPDVALVPSPAPDDEDDEDDGDDGDDDNGDEGGN